jgi:hypothetical protein
MRNSSGEARAGLVTLVLRDDPRIAPSQGVFTSGLLL